MKPSTNAQTPADSRLAEGRRRAAMYRGVRYLAKADRYQAYTTWEGRIINLTVHAEALDAAIAADAKARDLWGDQARLNFPAKGERDRKGVVT